ncbi:MAG: DUF3795 domain-containing protein [Candidatus Bathyarchaeia archaeon]
MVYKNCHGCGCNCDSCAASPHHKQCDIYKCCVEQRGLEACGKCGEFPCSQLIQFCYNPVWQHHLTAIENLRRRRALGTGRWLEEQKKAWSNEWQRKKWLWLQRECEDRLKKSKEETEP